MNPDSFKRILHWLEDHQIFKNNGEYFQISPIIQLMVALRRYGCKGSSAAATMSVAQLFGVGEFILGYPSW